MQYRGPNNDTCENPSLEFLRTIIFERGHDYWDQGSGDSGLWPEVGEPLIFFYDHPHGFYMGFSPGGDVEVVPYDGGPCDEVVTHFVGGEPMRRPRACFISREQAWDIVQEFVCHHRRSPRFTWTSIGDLDFETGYDAA
jgi:hypothetical protein